MSLEECPPYTEIFSKRRKICSFCVEGSGVGSHLPKMNYLYLRRPTRPTKTLNMRCRMEETLSYFKLLLI